jgi:predicted RNA-binding Zn-ribbon protein involved in translation (DUF1610 family)
MITEIASALATIKTSVDLLTKLNSVAQDEKVRSAVFNLQNDLLSLQTKLFETNDRFQEQSDRLKELQRELDSKNRWEEDEKKYEVFHPSLGMTVYRLKDNSNVDQIWACPNCFGNQKISILNKRVTGDTRFGCHGCGFEIFIEYTDRPIRRRPGGGWMKP